MGQLQKILFGVGVIFTLLASSLCSAADVLPAPPAKNFFSDFDLGITNRYWFAPQSVNSYMSNEILINYNFNNRWSLSTLVEYDLMSSMQSAANSDFLDTDVRLTYKYAPSQKQIVNWDLGGTFLISIPTSRSSQSQAEYAGLGLKAFGDVTVGRWAFSLSSRYYEYYYENAYLASTPQGTDKSEPDNDTTNSPEGEDAIIKYTANCNSYSDSSFVVVLNPFANFLMRNEVRYEAYGYFDGHYSSLFHDKYGIGYNVAPEFSIWVSQDAVKNADLPGSLFDSQYITTVVSLYWRI